MPDRAPTLTFGIDPNSSNILAVEALAAHTASLVWMFSPSSARTGARDSPNASMNLDIAKDQQTSGGHVRGRDGASTNSVAFGIEAPMQAEW